MWDTVAVNRGRTYQFLLVVGVGLSFLLGWVSAVPAAVEADGYSDVGEAGPHSPSIHALSSGGLDLLAGTDCAPGSFCPDDPLLRWVMAVWLVRVLDGEDPDPSGEDPDPSGESRFADVGSAEWWAPFTDRLAVLGVTAGCRTDPPGYCPQRPVTRGQMASFLSKAFDLPEGSGGRFSDVSDSPHTDGIYKLAAAGITVGDGQGRFYPGRPVTRGQMATFLARALQLVPPTGYNPTGDYVLAYTQGTYGDRSLWITETGGIRGEIAPRIRFASDISFSPDGNWVVYSPGNRSNLLNIDNGERRSVGDISHISRIVWSPDSKFLAYRDGWSWTNYEYWVEQNDGQNKRKLTDTEGNGGFNDYYSQFALDSSHVMYPTLSGAYFSISMNLHTGNQAQITDGRRDIAGGFLPDGRIYYKKYNKGSDLTDMWLTDINGDNRQRIANDVGSSYAWSPDGSLFVYRSISQGDEIGDYFVTDDKGNVIAQYDRLGSCEYILWAGNEQFIVMGRGHPKTVNTRTLEVQELSMVRSWVTYESSPDRQWIAYSGESINPSTGDTIEGMDDYEWPYFNGQLWIEKTDGSERRKLVDYKPASGTQVIKNFVWSPDNQYIALEITTVTEEGRPDRDPKDIWIVDTDNGTRWKVAEGWVEAWVAA